MDRISVVPEQISNFRHVLKIGWFISIFVSIYTPISGSILVNVFELFSPNTLVETFFTRLILKFVRLNLVAWTVFECMDKAESSHFLLLKQLLRWLVLSWAFWIVLPK